MPNIVTYRHNFSFYARPIIQEKNRLAHNYTQCVMALRISLILLISLSLRKSIFFPILFKKEATIACTLSETVPPAKPLSMLISASYRYTLCCFRVRFLAINISEQLTINGTHWFSHYLPVPDEEPHSGVFLLPQRFVDPDLHSILFRCSAQLLKIFLVKGE